MAGSAEISCKQRGEAGFARVGILVGGGILISPYSEVSAFADLACGGLRRIKHLHGLSR